MQDQIEVLTQERNAAASPASVSRPASALPASTQVQRNALLDSATEGDATAEHPHEGRRIAVFETVLTWIAWVAIVAVAVLVTWASGSEILKYLRAR